MSLADELLKLEQLRDRATISGVEFQQAKAALLAGAANADPAPHEPSSAVLLEQLRREAELTRIDREWELERREYLIRGKYGSQHVPTVGGGFMTAILGGGFGAFWTIFVSSITNEMGGEGLFGLVRIFFPLSGVVLTLLAIGWGIVCTNRALKYNEASAAYEARRREVLNR